MDNTIKLAETCLRIAKSLVSADYEYIYDPDHKKHPGGGYIKTEKGWAKGSKGEEKGNGGKARKSQMYLMIRA